MTIARTPPSSRRQRGAASPWRPAAAAVMATTLAGCSLLSRPEPMETLQLLPPVASPAAVWPDNLEPGQVTASAALQSDRVLVMRGALLMQHGGMRWVDVPAGMLAEQVRAQHLRAEASAPTGASVAATLDIWLTEFNIRIVDGDRKTVVVTASGELRCPRGDRKLHIAPVVGSQPVTGVNAAEIAAAFAQATDGMLTTLLSKASTRASACGESAPSTASGQ